MSKPIIIDRRCNISISIGDALLHLGVDKSELDAGMKKATDSIKSQMKTTGMALTAFGAAVTGALAMSVKAAAEEEAGIIKMTQALKNVGIEYDDVRKSLEANITATQRKTSIADDRQRESLQRLLEVTGDYQQSLDLLPLALDMAIAKGMDAASASEIIGRVAAGNTTILARYGIQLKEGATAVEALGALHQKFGGQAEAYGQSLAGQFDLLKNSISDIQEAIGSLLMKSVKPFISDIQVVVNAVQDWIDINPELVSQLVNSTAKIGLLSLALGSAILMVPKLIGLVISITGLLGPWGWAVVGITTLLMLAVAEVMGLSDAIVGLNSVMAEVEKQMFKMRVEQAFSKEEWAKIKEQGYLTEEQFKRLAGTLKITTEELYDQMASAGMLVTVMTSLGDTNVYLAEKAGDTEKAIRALTQANIDATEAADENAEAEKRQIEAFEDLLKQLKYNDSEAGKYNITMGDIYQTMYRLGYMTDEIRGYFEHYGNEVTNVEDALSQLGLTAGDINYVLDKQTDIINKNTDAYIRQTKAAEDTASAIATVTRAAGYTGDISGFGRGMIEAGMSAYQKAYAMGISEEEYERRYGSYQHGGPIIEPTLLYGLRSLKPYALAHEGERVVSQNQPISQTITIYLDGRQIGKGVFPYLTPEVILKTGIRGA